MFSVSLEASAQTPVYGLAESSVGLAFPPLERGPRIDYIQRDVFLREARAEPAEAGAATAMPIPACGRALPGHEIRIVDETDQELPDRRVGRLQFRGPSATSGYYRNPAATARLMHAGWLDSGDYAYTVEGEIYLTGRIKDLIIRGGRNLYPYELEQAVGELAGVRKGCIAVFASVDAARGTERLVVLAETREQNVAVREALMTRINEVAVDVMGMPADVVVLAPPHSVLKTSSGKIRRAACRAAYEQGVVGVKTSSWRQTTRLGWDALRARLASAARLAAIKFYGVWCWMVFVLLAAPVAILLSLLQNPRLGRRLAYGAARLFSRLVAAPVRATRLDALPQIPHLLLCNHTSYIDTIALVATLPPDVGYAFVAKRELAQEPLLRSALRGLGALFVERYDAAKSADDVSEIVAALRAGQSLVMFPEGTFSRESGLKPFRMGAFVAAARAGVPLVVGALRGTRVILRDKTWLPRHGKPEFHVGATYTPDGDDWKAAVRLRDATRAEMLSLAGEHDLAR